ncbi:hypothetical protein [Bacillus mycoides]|uniref:hypothetical protein n=1 Tax=Bacillus mycoides TaxID=1405 RepID=UPI001642D8AD|nr:hypothetical protein [Bacillus mycoides]
MGRGLREEEGKVVGGNVESVVVWYDGDKGGREGRMKGGELVVQVGCEVKVI